MALTDTAIKTAKPLFRQYRLTDGQGLYLLIRPNGSKLWRQDYRFASKDKTLSVGIYPDVSLKLARERRDEIRALVAQGIDPSLQRKTSKLTQTHLSANTFEAIAREWFTKQATAWAKSHSSKIIQRLERDIFPWLGSYITSDITAPELLNVIRKIETRGKHETAHRALQNCSQIFRYAVATGRAQRDPCADLKGALTPVKSKHFAAITDSQEVGKLLKAIDTFVGTYIVKTALQLAPLVFVRPGELRQAQMGRH